MALRNVPDDVLRAIFRHLEPGDLVSARSVCRTWARVATTRLFHAVTLRPTLDGFERWYRCAENPYINMAARRIVIHTTDEASGVYSLGAGLEAFEPHRTEAGEEKEEKQRPLSLLSEFPRASELRIVFSPLCLGKTSNQQCDSMESVSMRERALSDIFEAAKKRHESAVSKIETLVIENLQNAPLPDLTSSPAFRAATRHVRHLDLHMIAERSEGHGLYYEMDFPERHTFDRHLQTAWVEPLSHRLETLSLGYDDWSFWGSVPGIFRPKPHGGFPRLTSLRLNQFVIAHDDDLDWVTDLPALKKLALDSCPIVSDVWVGQRDRSAWELDTRDWVRVPPSTYNFDVERAARPDELYRYPGTWERVFDQIRRRLPELEGFDFVTAWGQRYVGFQDGNWPTPWRYVDGEGDMEFGSGGGEGGKGPKVVNRARETDEGDRRALEELRRGVGGVGVPSRMRRVFVVRRAVQQRVAGVLEFCRSPKKWLIRKLTCPVCAGWEDM